MQKQSVSLVASWCHKSMCYHCFRWSIQHKGIILRHAEILKGKNRHAPILNPLNVEFTSRPALISAAACGRKVGRAWAQPCSTYSRHVLLGTKPDTRPSGLYLGASRISDSCLFLRCTTEPITGVDEPMAPAMTPPGPPLLPAAAPCFSSTGIIHLQPLLLLGFLDLLLPLLTSH